MGATQYAFSTILLFVLNLKVGVCLSFCNFMNEKRGWEGWMGGGGVQAGLPGDSY